jgi:glycine/D-amino acid oxidase-like deaminating enzyme
MATKQVDKRYRGLSFWHDSAPGKLRPRPALTGTVQADVAIVGAGYTGLWTAYYLKKLDPGLNIAVVEAEIAGYGASGRNGGWCAAYLSGIDDWYQQADRRESAIRLQRLMFDSVAEVGEVARREGIDCHFEQAGTLEIAVNGGQLKRARESLAQARELGFGDDDYRWLEPAQLGEELVVQGALGAVHASHTAAIHPARLVRGLADTVAALGVDIYENSPVTGIDDAGLATAGGNIRADCLLFATEGYTDSLPGCRHRLIPVHSMMVVTEPLDPDLLDEIRFRRRYTFCNLDHMVTYGQLTADRRIAFGCRGSYHFGSRIRQFEPREPEFSLIRESLLKFFPALKGIRFTHAWGGAMGVGRKFSPSVNFDTSTRRGWAGGYFGNGVGAANLAGRTLADLVLGRNSDRLLTPWVNPSWSERKWEPEPLRWMGYRAMRLGRQLADYREYRQRS